MPNGKAAETRVRPIAYEVSIWPEAVECSDSSTWRITVAYRGCGKWAVLHGQDAHGSLCLSAAGHWDFEHSPSGRTGEWEAAHRFDLETALTLAREHAPGVTVNGMTAAEVLAGHGPTSCDG